MLACTAPRSNIRFGVWWNFSLLLECFKSCSEMKVLWQNALVFNWHTKILMSSCRHHLNVCPPMLLVAALPALTDFTIYLSEKKTRCFIQFTESNVCMYGFKFFKFFYIITLFKYWNQSYLVSAIDDIKSFLPRTFSPLKFLLWIT